MSSPCSRRAGRAAAAGRSIIVQNLPVPFDRRVWLECQSLRGAGVRRHRRLPAGQDSRPYQVIDDVEIYTYPPYAPGGSARGFVVEYA